MPVSTCSTVNFKLLNDYQSRPERVGLSSKNEQQINELYAGSVMQLRIVV